MKGKDYNEQLDNMYISEIWQSRCRWCAATCYILFPLLTVYSVNLILRLTCTRMRWWRRQETERRSLWYSSRGSNRPYRLSTNIALCCEELQLAITLRTVRVYTRVGTLIVATIYLQLIQN